MKDGIYLEVFCVKGEKRYNLKILSASHLCRTLAGAVADAFCKTVEFWNGEEKGEL